MVKHLDRRRAGCSIWVPFPFCVGTVTAVGRLLTGFRGKSRGVRR